MKRFEDERGRHWIAEVAGEWTLDYKGRYWLVLRPDDADPADEEALVELTDVRWNTEKTARRTLETMSGVELRRRLRSARGRRAPAPLPELAED